MPSLNWHSTIDDVKSILESIFRASPSDLRISVLPKSPHKCQSACAYTEASSELVESVRKGDTLLIVNHWHIPELVYQPIPRTDGDWYIDDTQCAFVMTLRFARLFSNGDRLLLNPSKLNLPARCWNEEHELYVYPPDDTKRLYRAVANGVKRILVPGPRGRLMASDALVAINERQALFNWEGVWYDLKGVQIARIGDPGY